MLTNILLQISTSGGSELGIATSEVASPSITLFDLILKGGIIMLPIFFLSILSIYIIIERLLALKKATENAENMIEKVKSAIKSGDIQGAKSSISQYNSPIARILQKGISKIGQPIKQIETSMETTGKIELMKLEKGFAWLGIVAAIAPMLGFVGTISGVIKIFYNISLADNISIGLIAGGLYEKMVTSAAGLLVGMIAHIGYHYLQMKIDDVVQKMEITSLEFIDIVSE